MLNVFGRRLRYGISVAALMAGTQAALLLNAYGGEGMAMVFSGAETSIKIVDSTTPSNDWDSAWGDGYSVQDFFKTRSFTSYTGPVSTGKRLMQADGYIKPCRHNLNKMSNRAASAAWTKQNASVVAKTAISVPSVGSGTTTDALRASGGAGVKPAMYQALTVPANIPFTLSAYCYAGTTPYVALNLWATGVNYAVAVFNLSAGSGSATETFVGATSGTIYATAITDAGGGWYRISMTASTSQTTVYSFHQIAEAATGNTLVNGQLSWTAAGTEDAYFWGMQTNNGYLLDYVSSEAHNICLQSQDVTTTWSNDKTTDAANSAVAPDGTTTADSVIDDATASARHIVLQTMTGMIAVPTTFSTYVKAGTRGFAYIAIQDASSKHYGVTVNLSTGAAGDTNSSGSPVNPSYTITSVGNGWYRVGVTITPTAGTGYVIIGGADSATPASYSTLCPAYNGDGVSLFYTWGMQYELASSPGKYVATTTTAVYNPHFDIPVEYNTDGTVKALTREEARTNLALYSNNFSSTWSNANSSDLQSVTNGPDGIASANSLTEDATAGVTHRIFQGVTIVSATTYCFSIYAKEPSSNSRRYFTLSLNTQANGSEWFAAMFDLQGATVTTSGTGTSGTYTSSGMEAIGNGWYRCYVVGSLPTTSAYALVSLADGGTLTSFNRGSDVYNGDGASNLYFWGAQLEAGSTASSPIVTGSAAVTRASDYIAVAPTVFPYAASATQYAAYTLNYLSTSAAQRACTLGVSNNDQIVIQANNTGAQFDAYITTGGAGQGFNNTAETVTAGTTHKQAFAYATNDTAHVSDGGTAVTDASVTLPAAPTLLVFGSDLSGTNGLQGGLEEYLNVPSRLANAMLQTLTTL